MSDKTSDPDGQPDDTTTAADGPSSAGGPAGTAPAVPPGSASPTDDERRTPPEGVSVVEEDVVPEVPVASPGTTPAPAASTDDAPTAVVPVPVADGPPGPATNGAATNGTAATPAAPAAGSANGGRPHGAADAPTTELRLPPSSAAPAPTPVPLGKAASGPGAESGGRSEEATRTITLPRGGPARTGSGTGGGPVPAPGPVPGPGPDAANPPPWQRIPGPSGPEARPGPAAGRDVLEEGPTAFLEAPGGRASSSTGAPQSGDGVEGSGAWSAVRSVRNRPPRQAALQLRRLDPWSVLKLSLVLAVVLFFVWLVAVGVIYGVLDGIGVWDRLNGTYADLVSGEASTGSPLISAGRVFGFAALIGGINALLFAVAATIAAFVYNVSADLVGGIEVTLSERD